MSTRARRLILSILLMRKLDMNIISNKYCLYLVGFCFPVLSSLILNSVRAMILASSVEKSNGSNVIGGAVSYVESVHR